MDGSRPQKTTLTFPRNIMLMTRSLGHGGTERQLAETALSLDPALFRPHIGCNDGQGFRADELRKRGIPILELPNTSFINPRCVPTIAAFRRYLRRHRIDLIHTFDTSMNVFGVPAGRLLACPVVLSSQRCFENVIWPRHRGLNRIAHRLADAVVANCHAVERHLRVDYGVPQRKIHVCYNALDSSVFFPAGGAKKRPEQLRDASLVIGSVSVLRPEKSLPTLLDAFALIRDVRPGLKLAIVGSGPVREALVQQAADLGIASQCHFFPATEDVASWLRAIDVFVLPSLSEALSNSLTEAMACACCAIASNVGGNPELVRHEQTGLLFEPGNVTDLAEQLRRATLDDSLRNRLGQDASAWVSANLSREMAARTMEQIYLRELEEHSSL